MKSYRSNNGKASNVQLIQIKMKPIFKVEKNIPLPKKESRSIYPFSIMEVGDSFLISCTNHIELEKYRQRISMTIWRFVKKNKDEKFQTKTTEQGVRVWRIK